MEQGYTLYQACYMLGDIDSKTLKDWMDKAGVQPTQGKIDKRYWYLTRQQLEIIADQHERDLLPAPRLKKVTRADLLTMIDAQNTEIAKLKTQLQELKDIRPSSPYRPPQRPPSSESISSTPRSSESAYRPPQVQPGQIGIGKRYAGRIAHEHGANSAHSATDWDWTLQALADETAALQFTYDYLAGHPRAGYWHHCPDPAHGCHQRGDDSTCAICQRKTQEGS